LQKTISAANENQAKEEAPIPIFEASHNASLAQRSKFAVPQSSPIYSLLILSMPNTSSSIEQFPSTSDLAVLAANSTLDESMIVID
jgi:hypothetical protein